MSKQVFLPKTINACLFCKILPGGDGAISQQPIDELFSHNAVGVGPQPVSVVLKLHPCAVVADFLPQVLQLRGVLPNIWTYKK